MSDGFEDSARHPLLHLIPVGEENAVSARVIWQKTGIGSRSSTKLKLSLMVAEGSVQRKRVPVGSTVIALYFREPVEARSSCESA